MSCPHGNPIGGCDTCDEVDAAFEAGKRSALADQPAQQEPDYKALYEKAVQQYNDLAELMAEQPVQQEPVAWDGDCVLGHCGSPAGCEASNCCRADYTTPPQRKPLTDEQVWNDDDLMKLNAVMMLPMDYFMRVVRAIEAAHNIKENT